MYEKIRAYIILSLILVIIVLFFFTVYYRYNYINSNLQIENIQQQNSLLQQEIIKQNKSISEYKEDIKNQINLISEINKKSSSYQKYIDYLRLELDKKNIQEDIKKDPVKANSEINNNINLQFNDIMDITK